MQKLKRPVLFILLLLCGNFITLTAQRTSPLSPERQQQLNKILNLLRQDHVAELATQVRYPLKRQNPLPNIDNQIQFKLYYSMLFDAEFKQKLLSIKQWNSGNTIERNGSLGLLMGDIWLDYDGKLITVNHQSPAEKELRDMLQNELKESVHPDVKPWVRNVLVFQSEKFLIRVDEMKGGTLRYASWNRPSTFSDKPALILKNGEEEYQGTMGGVTYTWLNGDWKYIIDEVNMAESEESMGTFLYLYQNEKQVLKVKGKRIK